MASLGSLPGLLSASPPFLFLVSPRDPHWYPKVVGEEWVTARWAPALWAGALPPWDLGWAARVSPAPPPNQVGCSRKTEPIVYVVRVIYSKGIGQTSRMPPLGSELRFHFLMPSRFKIHLSKAICSVIWTLLSINLLNSDSQQGSFLPSRGLWQCLERFLVVTIGRGAWLGKQSNLVTAKILGNHWV